MTLVSQIVETNASRNFHSMGRAIHTAPPHNWRMSEDMNGGPNFLRAWREHREMSQEALATALDTTASVISYLEQGKRGLSAKWLRKLAVPLRTTPGLLLDHDPADLSEDMIDMWARADARQRQQVVSIVKTIIGTGTDG